MSQTSIQFIIITVLVVLSISILDSLFGVGNEKNDEEDKK